MIKKLLGPRASCPPNSGYGTHWLAARQLSSPAFWTIDHSSFKYFLPILFICLFWFQCGKKAADTESDAGKEAAVNVEVEAAPVEQGEIRQVVEASGTLNAPVNQDVKVAPLVAGKVTELNAVEGDSVAQGGILARLDSSTLQQQLKQAQATLQNAKANQERAQHLFERGIAARKEWEDAQKDFTLAQSTVETAQIEMSRTVIHSPISGIITKRFTNVGEQVDGTASQPIVEVANFDPIEMLATLQAGFLRYVKEGATAEVRTDAYPGTTFIGTVISILPSIEATTNMATLRVRIPNTDHRLRGGMFGTASIVADVHPNALYVPASSITSSNNQNTIFVVRTNSTVEARRVEIGWRDANKVEILSNVKKGELVVTTGSYGLSDNMHVTVKNKATAAKSP